MSFTESNSADAGYRRSVEGNRPSLLAAPPRQLDDPDRVARVLGGDRQGTDTAHRRRRVAVERLVGTRHAGELPGQAEPGHLPAERTGPVGRTPPGIAGAASGEQRGALAVTPGGAQRGGVAVHLEGWTGLADQRPRLQHHPQRAVAQDEVHVVV